jgi:16S rRNA (cytosine967-C5)-methyltransferase
MQKTQRAAAALVDEVLRGHSLARRLPAAREVLPAPARGALTDLTQGALRHLGTLRALVRLMAAKPPEESAVEALLVVALYQLVFTDTPAHVVTDQAVAAARTTGRGSAGGLVNALLRRFLRERQPLLVAARATPEGRWSHPDWWISRLDSELGTARAEAVLAAGLGHPPMAVRPNACRIEPAIYAARLEEAGHAHRCLDNGALLLDHPVPAQRLPGFEEGLVAVQDAGAQWAAVLLDAREGERVLDACAAPGGKTAHLLECAAIELVALDRDAARLEDARRLLARLGHSATLQAADAADPDAWWDGRSFRRILLDAPCSASGIVRRHPDAKWLRRESDLAGFAREQARLLDGLWKVLEPGGTLLYATCSVFRDENAGTVECFLARRPDARRLPLQALPGGTGELLPDHEHDGFFYALLQKRPD